MTGRKRLLILHCYGVYHRGTFYGKYPEHIQVYKAQLRKAFELLNSGGYDVLIISGGYTKKEVEKSEARGMLDWAEDLGLTNKRGIILLEEYARDSLENLLFGMCRFFQFFGEFPKAVGSLTWKFNKERYEVFAQKLKLPNFEVITLGEIKGEGEIAQKWARLAKEDPFYQKQPDSKEKYLKRDPWKKTNPYASINADFQRLFTKFNEIKEKKGRLEEATNFFPWK
jgi:hypothetical protein